MPATRQMKAFKVKNQNGETITVNRRCFGSGTVVQKQLDTLVYDEQTKKFRMPDQDMAVCAFLADLADMLNACYECGGCRIVDCDACGGTGRRNQ